MVDARYSLNPFQKLLEKTFHEFKQDIGKKALIARLPGRDRIAAVYAHYDLNMQKHFPPLFLISQHHPMKLEPGEEVILIEFRKTDPNVDEFLQFLEALGHAINSRNYNQLKTFVQRKKQKNSLQRLYKNLGVAISFISLIKPV